MLSVLSATAHTPHTASSAQPPPRRRQGGGNPLARESHCRRATVPSLQSGEIGGLGSEGRREGVENGRISGSVRHQCVARRNRRNRRNRRTRVFSAEWVRCGRRCHQRPGVVATTRNTAWLWPRVRARSPSPSSGGRSARPLLGAPLSCGVGCGAERYRAADDRGGFEDKTLGRKCLSRGKFYIAEDGQKSRGSPVFRRGMACGEA